MAALYTLAYDLHNERDYDRLHEELKRMGAVRVLESTWCFQEPDRSSQELLSHFQHFVDLDDSLFIIQTSDWATHQTEATPDQLSTPA